MIKIIDKSFKENELKEICINLGMNFDLDISKEDLIKLIITEGYEHEVMKNKAKKKEDNKKTIETEKKKNHGFNPNVITYPLSKELTFENKIYKEVTIDMDSLTGEDMKQVYRRMSSNGEIIGFCETNKVFLSDLAEVAMGVPIGFMDSLNVKDFSIITMLVQDFLL